MPISIYLSPSNTTMWILPFYLNKTFLQTSTYIGCFTCFNTFTFNDITKYTDDQKTAWCPKCKIDSVIGSDTILTKKILEKIYENVINTMVQEF